jgi:hypothetical protein
MDPNGEPYGVTGLGPLTPKVLGLLGARYIVLGPGAAVRVPGLRRVYAGRDATIFSNAQAVPRVFIAARVGVAEGTLQEISSVTSAGFDARRDAVVRNDELGGAAPAAGGGTVRVVSETNARVALRASLARDALVVLDDTWAPGWTVRVDGAPAPALRTDVVLRGVVVPAGRHQIVWSYTVPGLRRGAELSLLGLLAVLGWGGRLIVRARRRAIDGS